jgi:hypothetical protein
MIPTYNHGAALRFATESALAQTLGDLEVLIVGDGAGDDSREIAMQLEKDDDRVRFFDNPKGPRHGEVHRHAALQEARGDLVCYLSDDDLWFPQHVEILAAALENADFAHTMTAWVHPDGSVGSFFGNLADVRQRRRLLTDKWNFIPLSAAAHTMAAYKRLPEGWRTTPLELWTDLHMWRQFLSNADCSAISVAVPTVVHLASSEREGIELADRVMELSGVVERLAERGGRARIARQAHEAAIAYAHAELIRIGDRMDGFEARNAELLDHIRWLEAALGKARAERDATRHKAERLRSGTELMQRSATWRLRSRLLRNPLVGALYRRMAARARSRSGPR